MQCFREWQTEGYGEIFVQANVEDTMLGVQEYAIKKLGVKAVELKWGQGAKDIGGEVKIKDLAKAQELERRAYVVLPTRPTTSLSRHSELREKLWRPIRKAADGRDRLLHLLPTGGASPASTDGGRAQVRNQVYRSH